MKSRALVMVALLASPAWSQEPAPENTQPVVQHFDLRSESVQQIVRNTAASQYSNYQVADKAPASAEPAKFVYVPPEKPPAPPSEHKVNLPERSPKSNGLLSSVVDILIDEALDNEQDDGVTSRNEILRCKVQKEQKTSPPGIDNCPTVD